jgi:hypothetical protein
MSKFHKIKKFNNSNCSNLDSKDSNLCSTNQNSTNQNCANSSFSINNSNYFPICPIPEIAKIQLDNNKDNIYIMVFMSEHSIYQKYKTTHSFEIVKPNIQDSFHFYSYFFHFQLPKTIQPFFQFDASIENEISNNQREYVIIGWIVRCGTIIGILYVQMYNQMCQNFNVLIIEDCPFMCFLGSLTNSFFGLFLNNIRIVHNECNESV